jgi:hypothetical protein
VRKMMNFNKLIGAGIALAGSTLVLGSTLSAPAQAFVLIGGDVINLTGGAKFATGSNAADPLSDTITFLPGTVAGGGTTTGGFLTLGLVGTTVNLTPISLSRTSFGNYDGTAANPFITFFGGLKFDVDNPIKFTRTLIGNLSAYNADSFTGTFYNADGIASAKGILTANAIGKNGSYSASIQVVPEPFTILGTATALGFGAFMKSKKKKEDKVSA